MFFFLKFQHNFFFMYFRYINFEIRVSKLYDEKQFSQELSRASMIIYDAIAFKQLSPELLSKPERDW